jgi:hypothetical protein
MFSMISVGTSLAWKAVLVACLGAAFRSVESESVSLTVVRVGTQIEKSIPSRLEAVIPADVWPEGSHKVRFYRTSLPVNLRHSDAQLAWFSYTNPPKDKGWVSIEADMPVFGGFIHRDRMYVCSPISTQTSTPVLNAFLRSLSVEKLSDSEVRDFALLTAKCMGATQIYGDSQRINDNIGRELLARAASLPTVETVEDHTTVVFYSWEALKGSVIRWSFIFGPKEIRSIHQEPVSGGQLILNQKR